MSERRSLILVVVLLLTPFVAVVIDRAILTHHVQVM